MDGQGKIFTRAQLHELVWLKPMQKLTAEFGLSDVGLAMGELQQALGRGPEVRHAGRHSWNQMVGSRWKWDMAASPTMDMPCQICLTTIDPCAIR